MAKMAAVRHDPAWSFKHEVWYPSGEDNEKIAIAREREDTADYKIYSDGSGYEGGIGAAVWMYDKYQEQDTIRREHIRQLYIGPATQHEVIEGKAIGLILALHIIRSIPYLEGQATVSIYTDSLAALTGWLQ